MYTEIRDKSFNTINSAIKQELNQLKTIEKVKNIKYFTIGLIKCLALYVLQRKNLKSSTSDEKLNTTWYNKLPILKVFCYNV